MTKIVCETATLADAVAKAARVAPTKGKAFDKSRGILFMIVPGASPVKLRIASTDLETTYLQRVATVDANGTDAKWRFPSHLLSGIMASLPPSGQVTLEQNDNDVLLSHAKTEAKLRLLANPNDVLVKGFDPNGLSMVEGFGKKLAQIAWAAHADHPVLSGIHIDGKQLMACNRACLATADCDVPVQEPITVLAAQLTPLLRTHPNLKLRALDKRLELMPDDDTQITTSILGGVYPGVDRIKRTEFQGEFTVNGENLRAGLERMLVLARGERYPRIKCIIEETLWRYNMHVETADNHGTMKDEIAIGPKAWDPSRYGDSFEFFFDPTNIIHAIDAGNAEHPVVKYGPTDKKPLHITDDRGFEFWGMGHIPTPQDKAQGA